MDAGLRAGIALYNTGRYRVASDVLDVTRTEASERDSQRAVFKSLDLFSKAIRHARTGKTANARESAGEALTLLAEEGKQFAGVDLEAVRAFLTAVQTDPTCVDRREPPTITHHGEALGVDDLNLDETAIVAGAIADREDEARLLEKTIEYARTDLEDDQATSPFVAFLFDYVREPQARGIVRQRLREHVQRRQSRAADVEGLFDANE